MVVKTKGMIGLLNDLFGYIRRNSKNWNKDQLKKVLIEIKQIQTYLERKLQEVA